MSLPARRLPAPAPTPKKGLGQSTFSVWHPGAVAVASVLLASQLAHANPDTPAHRSTAEAREPGAQTALLARRREDYRAAYSIGLSTERRSADRTTQASRHETNA